MVLIGGFFVDAGFIFRVRFWTGLQQANQFPISGFLDAMGTNAKMLKDVGQVNAAEAEDTLRLITDFAMPFWSPRPAHV